MSRLRWITPEGFAFELPLAGVATRCLAWLVDVAVMGAGLVVLSVLLNPAARLLPGIGAALELLTSFGFLFLYAAALEWFWQGQTVGKRAFGLRVMDARGLPLSGAQVLMRNLLRVVDLLPGFYLVGGISSLATRHGQRVGDLVAGTVVARPRSAPAPDLTPWLAQKYNSFNDYPQLAARLRELATPSEAGLVLEALVRRDSLLAGPREAIYRDLMAYFQARVQFPPVITEALSPEQYLRNVAGVLFPSRFAL